MTQTMQPPAQKPGFGILPVSTILLERLFCLPENYRIIGMNFDVYKRTLDLTVTSDELPEVEEGCEFPRLELIAKVETLIDRSPEYRKITTEVKVL